MAALPALTILGVGYVVTLTRLAPADPQIPAPVAQVTPPASAAPVVAPLVTEGPAELLLEVQTGDTLDSLFRLNDLSVVDLAQIMALDPARRNLRVLRPGDTIRILHDEGRIVEMDRDIDIGQALHVNRMDPDFRAEVVRLPVEHRQAEAAGRISSSLFEAAAEAKISEQLIMKLADIFAWDIDFVRDIGEGDEFTLIYEELWRDGAKLGEGNILAAEFVNRGARYTAVRFGEGDGRPAYYTRDGQPMRKAFVRAPVAFTRISSGFNPFRRHPILNTIRAHKGVDYAAPAGTPVKAAGDGKVIFRGWKSGYGNTVIVQHGGNITTLYGHLSRFSGQARYGARVQQGDVIAFVGATGLATAPHLHYEYRVNGVHLNPRTVTLPNAQPLNGRQLTAFQGAAQPLLDRMDSRRSVLAANVSAGGT